MTFLIIPLLSEIRRKSYARLINIMKKRKLRHIDEAIDYARSIKERFDRLPVPCDFWEEFPLFLKREEDPEDIPVRYQLGDSYNYYRKNHVPRYDSFSEFLKDAGIQE